MKQNIRRLDRLVKLFGYESFYRVGITIYNVEAQGHFTPEIIKKAMALKFKSSVSTSGYVELERGNYKITLT